MNVFVLSQQGVVGYIAGRREKGSFVIKDGASGKKLLEITPRKLIRVTRPKEGRMIMPQFVTEKMR